MGGGYSGGTNYPQMLQAYSQYLPQIMQSVSGALPSSSAAQAQATIGATGLENAANLSSLSNTALPEAQIGQQIENQNALSGAQTNVNQLTGPGGTAAITAGMLNQALNPAYYGAMNSAGTQAGNLVNSINMNGLSPGEYNSTERSLNQNLANSGNLGLNNPFNDISNAMNFGGAFNSKIGILGSALNSAANVGGAASSNAGFNPVSTALSQPNAQTQTNFGTGQFVNTTPQSSSAATGNAANLSSGLLGNLTSMANTQNSAAANYAASTSPASYMGACCFIFLESYHGKLPPSVRKARDKFYKLNKDMATGYRRMAKWLVPLMKKHSLVRSLVWNLMVKPATDHCNHPRKGWKKTLSHFWLRYWSITGKNHQEVEYV